MRICFITGNAGKVETLKHYLDQYGIEIEQEQVEIIEPQAETMEEVAKSKARQAFAKLKRPLLVQDAGFCIDSMKAFPGAYTRYILDTIGIDGLLKLVAGTDRKCRFKNAVAFVDEKGEFHVFTDEIPGTIIEEKTEIKGQAWSELWSVFVPEGRDKTLGQMDEKELAEYWESRKDNSAFASFAKWLSQGIGVE